MPPINFRALTKEDLDAAKDPGLGSLNDKWRELVDAVNVLMGTHGPIPLAADLDLQGNRIKNIGKAVDTGDAISQSVADSLYGASAQQKNMEAVGNSMLQTTRRLNDGTQQHVVSSDLNTQGTIPPTITGSLTYAATTTSITWTWTNLRIQYGDGTIVAIPDGSQACTGLTVNTPYFFYPYWDAQLNNLNFVADNVAAQGSPAQIAFPAKNSNAAQTQNSDGFVPLSSGAMAAATTSTGTGGGTGGGGGCVFGGLYVESRSRGIIPIRDVAIGEQIRSRKQSWTRVKWKRKGTEQFWVRLALSNKQVLVVTSSDPIATFGNETKEAGNICLLDLLRGISAEGEEVPLQILELSPLHFVGDYILIGCEPDHEFTIGSFCPSVFLHNVNIPK